MQIMQKIKAKAKASGGLSKNKKGMTLVELIIAIAILGILVSPLLHAFVTSLTLEKKSRRVGEATDAAHNIEGVIDSMKVFDFKTSPTVKDLLDCDSVSAYGADGVKITKIKSGTGVYDAVVNFSSGSPSADPQENAFFDLNEIEIIDYADPDGTFAQPYDEDSDPDKIADTYFYAESSNGSYQNKERKIIIDITGEYDDPANKTGLNRVYVNATYHYEYTYKRQKIDLSGAGMGSYENVEYTKDIIYSVIPSGVVPHPDGSNLNVNVMYFPYYEFGHEDEITINNLDDINIKVFLVKQWTLAKMTPNGEYEFIPENDFQVSFEENGVTKTETRQGLRNLELNYTATIKENHSSGYNLNTGEQTVYTNARLNLCSVEGTKELIPGVKYKQYAGYSEITKTYQINNGNVIALSNNVRVYDITIDIYEVGEATPFASFRSSKIN